MKSLKKLWLVPCALLSTTAMAVDYNAQSITPHPYIGLGYSYVDTDVDWDGTGSENTDSGMLGLIVGYQLHQNIGVEFRGYGNVSDGDAFGSKVEINSAFSLFARGIVPVSENFTLYGLLGAGKVKAKVDDYSETESEIQYGVGMAINKGQPLELQVEWLRMFDDSFDIDNVNLQGDSINVNLVYHL
ncbi:porin family protein [Vibrio sp. CDRSL-10 TSBA]